jgi:hypothetical protein
MKYRDKEKSNKMKGVRKGNNKVANKKDSSFSCGWSAYSRSPSAAAGLTKAPQTSGQTRAGRNWIHTYDHALRQSGVLQ